MLVSLTCEKTWAFRIEELDPQLNYIFGEFERLFRKEIIPLIGGKNTEIELRPIKLSTNLKYAYGREFQEDQTKKLKKERIETEELNCFIFASTTEENLLPKIGALDEVEFVYKNWKISDANNSSHKVIGIAEKKGKYKLELLRRIFALANVGGGILFWGINE